jgi:hypothetical protein
MGLDISHDAFSGAYSAFNRLRQVIAEATGGSFPPHDDPAKNRDWYYSGDVHQESMPGLWEFMLHSDCDGEIAPDLCARLADDLEQILPRVEALQKPDAGHIARAGGYAAVVRQLIKGARAAAEAGEPLEFY